MDDIVDERVREAEKLIAGVGRIWTDVSGLHILTGRRYGVPVSLYQVVQGPSGSSKEIERA